MGKALVCARLEARVYLRSGKVIFPLLLLVGIPLILYQVGPLDAVGSFALSAAGAFVFGLWLGVSLAWGETPLLSQILSVKAGVTPLLLAQGLVVTALAALGGAFLALYPLIAALVHPSLFLPALVAEDAAAAFVLNVPAAVSGALTGSVFHPRAIRDRKLAWLLAALLCLLGFVGGIAGLPPALRLLFPPLYDMLTAPGAGDAFPAGYPLRAALRFLAYGAVALGLRVYLLNRRRF